MTDEAIVYPYLPEGRAFKYVDEKNDFMKLAKRAAKVFSLDETMSGGAVIVKNGIVIGVGANGSDYHKKHPCQRVIMGCKTGEGYELCEGCHPKNHSEPKALSNAISRGWGPNGADLYLWGHWWCCKWCWDVMIDAGIENVYLLNGSEVLFNKNHPYNIVGKQFEVDG